MKNVEDREDGQTVTVRVPISIRRREAWACAGAQRYERHCPASPPPYRRRHGQGDCPGIPMARDARERRVRHHSRDRERREINGLVGRVLG